MAQQQPPTQNEPSILIDEMTPADNNPGSYDEIHRFEWIKIFQVILFIFFQEMQGHFSNLFRGRKDNGSKRAQFSLPGFYLKIKLIIKLNF